MASPSSTSLVRVRTWPVRVWVHLIFYEFHTSPTYDAHVQCQSSCCEPSFPKNTYSNTVVIQRYIPTTTNSAVASLRYDGLFFALHTINKYYQELKRISNVIAVLSVTNFGTHTTLMQKNDLSKLKQAFFRMNMLFRTLLLPVFVIGESCICNPVFVVGENPVFVVGVISLNLDIF